MVVLPSSPVWYQSRGCDTSPHGKYAFASRNLIYIIDLHQSPLQVTGILSGHAEKVTSCSFEHNLNALVHHLVTGSEDTTIKVWDVERKVVTNEHNEHRNPVVAVHWSPVAYNLVFSGDDKGIVVCWNLADGSFNRYQPDGTSQMQLTALTCSPNNKDLVAIGYKSGAVSVMDITKNGTVVRKFRGHQSDIHSLVWVPQKSCSIFEDRKMNTDPEEYEGVLMSGSRDATIRVWSLPSSKSIKTLRIPPKPSKGRRSQDDTIRLFLAIHWPSDSYFVSSGYNGDIIMWDFNSPKQYEIIAGQNHSSTHQRIVFNICQGGQPNSIITSSMDRTIMHWTLGQLPSDCKGPDWTMATLGGFVYAIAMSNHDESVIAIGVGDGTIRIWKTMNPRNNYDIITLWQGVKEKVMSLSWHPTVEGLLAFGTEDGKVGIYDVRSFRQPTISPTYHMKPVYSLSWGPKCRSSHSDPSPDNEDSESTTKINVKKLCLFSCGGDGVVYQHNGISMTKDAVNIRSIILDTNQGSKFTPGRHSDIEWKSDLTMVAIGNDNGVIDIYRSPHLQHVAQIKAHNKIINCIKWQISMEDQDQCLLASGSNTKTLTVFDIQKVVKAEQGDNGETDEVKVHEFTDPLRTLTGHMARITSLSWNPHNNSKIASASYDGTVQIWDVVNELPLHNFRGHNGRVMCVQWAGISGRDGTGVLFSGADDYSVHRWFADDQQFKEPPKNLLIQQSYFNKQKNNKKRAKQARVQRSTPTDNQVVVNVNASQNKSPVTNDLSELLDRKQVELLAATGQQVTTKLSSSQEQQNASSSPENINGHNTPTPTPKLAINFSKTVSPRTANVDEITIQKKKLKNLFPVSVTQDNRNKSQQHKDIVDIIKWRESSKNNNGDIEIQSDVGFVAGENERVNLGFYTDRRAAHRMLSNEHTRLKEDGVEAHHVAKIWAGDIVGALEDAESKSELTEHLVSLAPSAGIKFWRRMTLSFAKQLTHEGHIIEAVQYLLSVGQVYEAIKLLGDNRMYREALALARARLDDEDEVLIGTIKMWAGKLKTGGSLELAAKCFCSLGDYEQAAECLAKRTSTNEDGNLSSMWAATSVARLSQNQGLADDLAHRSLTAACVRLGNWAGSHADMSNFDNLTVYRLILVSHEILICLLLHQNEPRLPETAFSNLSKSTWINNVCLTDNFYTNIQKIWKSELNIGKDSDPHDRLCAMKHEVEKEASRPNEHSKNLTPKQFLYQVSLYATTLTLSALINNSTDNNEENIHDNSGKLSELFTAYNWKIPEVDPLVFKAHLSNCDYNGN